MEERKRTKFGRKKISVLTHKTGNNTRKENETKQKSKDWLKYPLVSSVKSEGWFEKLGLLACGGTPSLLPLWNGDL